MRAGQYVEEPLRHDQFHFVLTSGYRQYVPQLAPIPAFHLAVILRQRVHHDLLTDALHGLVVFRAVVLEDTRHDVSGIGRSAKNLGNSLRGVAFTILADKKIKAGRGTVHLAKLGEAVGTKDDGLVDPKPITKIRHLNHDWRKVER